MSNLVELKPEYECECCKRVNPWRPEFSLYWCEYAEGGACWVLRYGNYEFEGGTRILMSRPFRMVLDINFSFYI